MAAAPEPPFGETPRREPAEERAPASSPAAQPSTPGFAVGASQASDPRELAALYMKLGMRALKEQQYARAIGLFGDALAQDETNSACWAALSQAYLLEGSDLEEAERCCRRALEGNR